MKDVKTVQDVKDLQWYRRALVLPLLALAVHVAIAQQKPAPTPEQQPPVFRTKTEIIRIDVTVLGPDGRPLKGLTREDFLLLEDGEPQPILGFGEVSIPDAANAPPWLRDSSPDVRTPLDGRVFVFLIDDAQMAYGLNNNLWRATVKRITDEIIERMGPRDAAAVLCTYSDKCDQDFTNDPVRLRSAIAAFGARGNPGELQRTVSSGMAQSVTEYLREDTSRRRTLIFISPSLPTRPEQWPPHRWGALTQQNIRTFEEAARARVVVYGVNPAGLTRLAGPAAEDPVKPASALDVVAPEAARPAPPGPKNYSAPERSLARETGGFIVSRPDQFEDGIDQIFRETGSYYLLGYEKPEKRDTGYNMLKGFREITVLVKREGATVKTHRGYADFKPLKPPKKSVPETTVALAGILPKTDLPLRMALSPFALPGKKEAVVAVAVGIRQPTPSARTVDRVRFQVRAFSQQGHQVAIQAYKLDVPVPTSREPDVLVEVVGELRLRPGVYAIRAAASSERMGTAGAVYADVEVPDFTKAPFSVSGIVLTPTPRSAFAPTGSLNRLVPTVPTTLRSFGRTTIAEAILRVYQARMEAPQPVELTMRVLDETGTRVFEAIRTLSADQFTHTQSVDVNFPIVAMNFSPGMHLLRVEAMSGGATIRRDVQFVVK